MVDIAQQREILLSTRRQLMLMLQELEHFVGIDQDASALEIAQQRLQVFEARGVNIHYIHSNFRRVCSIYQSKAVL